MTTHEAPHAGPVKATTHVSLHMIRCEPGNNRWAVWLCDESGDWKVQARWAMGHPASEWDLDNILGVFKEILVEYLTATDGYQPYLRLVD